MSTLARPNLFLVGAMKSATTSLYAYLGQHPEIDFSVPKEPNYFGESGTRAKGTVSAQDYAALFASHQGRYSGDATVRYLFSTGAAREIADHCPDARIIAIFRNPIDRAYSHYWHNHKIGAEHRSFATSLHEELQAVPSGECNYDRGYVAVGMYAAQAARFLDAFPRSSIRFVLTEALASTPATVCEDLFRFLGLDLNFSVDTTQRLNPSGIQIFPGLRQRLLTQPLLRAAARSLLTQDQRARVVWTLDSLLTSKRRTPPIEPGLRKELAAILAPDVRRLARLTGIDFSLWHDWAV